MKTLIVVVMLCASCAAGATTRPAVCAGAYYFDGWTGQTNHLTDRLANEFSDREPVWGWRDDSPDVMNRQIDYAADNGLRFFAFDWYWPEEANKTTPLNTGLDLFLKAANRNRLQFCLMVANHGGFRIGPKDWEQVSAVWIELFKQPTHLTVDGKPLLIFFSPREMRQTFGASAEVKKAFDSLRQRARDAGLPGVTIAACATPGPQRNWDNLPDLAADGYDVLTGYNYHGHPIKGGQKIQAFATMMEGHEEIWNLFAQRSPLPYMPCVTVGWDKRPWESVDLPIEKRSVYYPDRTPPQVAEFIARAIRWMDHNAQKTTTERVLLLYAWNENGEGGYLTPTKSMGDTYLKAVKSALQTNK